MEAPHRNGLTVSKTVGQNRWAQPTTQAVRSVKEHPQSHSHVASAHCKLTGKASLAKVRQTQQLGLVLGNW